ncbi:short-chain dehydrogenase reductase sdr [Trichoderma arundinaceum]|uniref:Short-chain dehydrogenase reductase sdr n=1 Tax=Trichoderma arundinaceum TaxID=490622 RepID=A0A395NI35_TRIAR|nr:short-chain dehydrogenase reductase sdr [Trichoderma arundinaceum]
MARAFENKYAIITGGSRGIGASIALLLAERGAKGIAIAYSGNEGAANDIVAKIKAYGADAAAIRANILDADIGETIVNRALSGLKTNTIHILINNAALATSEHLLPILDTTVANFDNLFHANVRAPIFTTRAVLPYMPLKGGRIINVSSVTAKQAADEPGILYGASKAALNSITRSMAGTFAAEKGVTINSISVGPTKTPAMANALANLPKEYMEGLKSYATAEKRLAEPEEIAEIVAFVASEEARWMNGASVPANGGSDPISRGLMNCKGPQLDA